MKNLTLLPGLLLATGFTLAQPAQSQPLQFGFVGTVTYTDGSLLGVDLGTAFTGSFSYDSTTQAYFTVADVAFYGLGSASRIDADIGGHAVGSANLRAVVANNLGSNVEDGITLSGGYPLAIDGSTFAYGSFGFSLSSRPGSTGALTGTALPTSYDLAAFDAGPSLTYGWLQRDGGQTGTMLQFTVDAVSAPVPEPEAYALMLAGLGLIGLMARRRG